jgi:hypothetical protein
MVHGDLVLGELDTVFDDTETVKNGQRAIWVLIKNVIYVVWDVFNQQNCSSSRDVNTHGAGKRPPM